jgi:hypothetical protein
MHLYVFVLFLVFALSLPCLCLIALFDFLPPLPCLVFVLEGPAEGKHGQSKQPLWMQQWKAQRLREQFDQGTIQINKVGSAKPKSDPSPDVRAWLRSFSVTNS